MSYGGNVNFTGSYQKATKHKLLTREEETSLAKAAEEGSSAAREKLITHNLRLALSIANKYRKAGLPMEDITQESYIGLIKAADRFDWRRGFRFSTYACWWIKQSVRRYVSGNSTQVKFPSGSRALIWKINSLRSEYENEFGCLPTDAEIATMLGQTEAAVKNLRIGMQWPINIDSPINGEAGARTFGEMIPDESLPNVDENLDKEKIVGLIKKALHQLTPQEEKVLRLRFGIREDENDVIRFPSSKNQECEL
jgi:RNA polymerase primary sigma factor